MNVLDPHRVELVLEDGDGADPSLELVEAYEAPAGVEQVARMYRELGAEVEPVEDGSELVVSTEGDDALRLGAAVAVSLLDRAGGADQLRAALAAAELDDDRRGFQ